MQSMDLRNVLKLEDVQMHDVDSVEGYIEELEWFKHLIEHHVRRCRHWKENVSGRPGLGELNEFLEQLEA